MSVGGVFGLVLCNNLKGFAPRGGRSFDGDRRSLENLDALSWGQGCVKPLRTGAVL